MRSSNLGQSCCEFGQLQESRSGRFNLPVIHPSKWRLLRELIFSSPNHIYRYRQLSKRMLEKTIRSLDQGDCQ